MRRNVIVLMGSLLIGGCAAAAARPFDADALNGKPYAEVVRQHRLDAYHSWPEMNTPPDEDRGVTYFVDGGNLTFKYPVDADGKPATVHGASFWPDSSPPDQRFQEANRGWSDYVDAHGGARRGK